jgi:phosphate uptake regulator
MGMMLMNTYDMVSGVTEVDAKEIRAEDEPIEDTVEQVQSEVVDTMTKTEELDNIMYTQIFNPLDSLQLGSSPFDKGGEFDIQNQIERRY